MDKPCFPRATPFVTTKCNLKCTLCSSGIPYYKSPHSPSVDYVHRMTDKLFEIADFDIFSFTGGESLIRRDLYQIWSYALRYIDNVKGEFRIVTNGSLVPDENLLAVLMEYGKKIFVIVDDYGPELSINAERAYDSLRNKGIRCDLRRQNAQNMAYFGGWVDFGYKDAMDRDPLSKAASKSLLKSCTQKTKLAFCCNVIDGIVAPCPIIHILKELHGVSMKKTEYLDLFDDTESVEAKRMKWSGFYNLETLNACKYCRGINDSSQRYTPADQIP